MSEQTTLGRPMKGRDRRIPTTVQISNSVLEILDDYVEERRAAGERGYSRSEFINEAMEKLMKERGLIPKDNQ